ncbi:MAG TPA: ATP-grasp domain-containing protein [Armatimonadaceae bacterium]|nr:ATP-grasp domain-containing protein [Armatimonadaceae bacterium]
MPTLLLPPRLNDDCRAMRRAAEKAGWDTLVGSWRIDPSALPPPNEVAFYGDSLFGDVAAARLGLGLLDAPPDWLPNLPERWRRRDVSLTTLEEARRASVPRFVKPPDDKSFPARVYASGVDLPGDDLLDPETPVLAADPVSWELEFRCFLHHGKVVTSSVYFRSGELAQGRDGEWRATETEAADARAFTADLLSDPEVSLPPAVVVDVGRISGRGWAVVEANPAWGSGLYGCAPEAVLPVLRSACVSRGDAAGEASARRWLRPAVTLEE